MSSLVSKFKGLYEQYTGLLSYLQSPLLLLIRLHWGYQFFLAGRGKLENLDRTAKFFADINIPMPQFNAFLAGSVECFGGLLLLLGLGSRIVPAPLIFTMVIAYITAHKEELRAIFSDPGKFTSADPFPFLLASLIVFAFGPGLLSADTVISKFFDKKKD